MFSSLMLAGLSGCASLPPPDNAMNQAQMAIQAAQAAQAQDYDPVGLGFARDRFQQALDAMRDHKYEQAGHFADEARADADLARVKAQLGAARAQIQSKTAENQSLREQIERAEAAAAAPPPAPSASPADAGTTTEGDMPAPPESVLGPASSTSTMNQGGQP
ncbi:DUF4398 domain-containing protein [Frateuria aurantia]